MHKIQANASGTRSIEVSDEHLETINKYQLFLAFGVTNWQRQAIVRPLSGCGLQPEHESLRLAATRNTLY